MRTIAGAAAVLPPMAQGTLSQQATLSQRGWATTVTRWLAAYMAWRIERRAIALLGAMSDHELGDIGLTRGEIEAAHGRDSQKLWTPTCVNPGTTSDTQ
jgi:uncharacterized protein YjiS (DUF1127 family)